MDKSVLRERFIERRRDMSNAAVDRLSEMITRNLMAQINWGAVRRIHVYESVRDWNEVRTEQFIEYVCSTQKQVEVVSGVASRTVEIPDDAFDVVIVPLLAFDSKLNRLGFGGGWYDRFLSVQPRAIKIGLAFNLQMADSVPTLPHDVALDMIVTETGSISR